MINETLTGTQTSTTTKPGGNSVDIIVSGDFQTGVVQLEYNIEGDSDWHMVKTFSGPISLVMATPDQTINYRFAAKNTGDVKVYMGP